MDISSFSKSASTPSGLDTVRALHQTVVSLRAALEASQTELSKLRDKIKNRSEYRDAIEKLSIENHILRRKIIDEKKIKLKDEELVENNYMDQKEDLKNGSKPDTSKMSKNKLEMSKKADTSKKSFDSKSETSESSETSKKGTNKFVKIPTIELPKSEPNVSDDVQTIAIKPDEQTEATKSTLEIERDLENLSISEGDNSVFSDLDVPVDNKAGDSENDSEEVDDIELIFTTDETKELGGAALQEDLVSISESVEKWRRESNTDTPVLVNFKTVDFDSGEINGDNLDDDVFDTQNNETSDNFENENTENLHFQGQTAQKVADENRNDMDNPSTTRTLLQASNEYFKQQKSTESTDSYLDSSFENRSLEKDESFDQFEERDHRLQKMWSQCSVLVETDISKCGVVDETEIPNLNSRRNTCPNPLQYRPIIHRDVITKTGARVKYSRSPRNSLGVNPIRPILNEKNSQKTESEAQTDISALPCAWKSESYLAHKVAHHFTTLPSKFALPVHQQPKIRLSEKTQEARRVLLSDINFTSMVPELSRSADHLCQEGMENVPPFQTYTKGQFLRTPETSRRCDLTDSLTSPNFGKFYSPSDYSNFGSSRLDNSTPFMSKYRGSLTSINSPSQYEVSAGRSISSYWRHNCPASFDNSRGNSFNSRPSYGSVPTSPTRQHRSRSVPLVMRSQDGSYSAFSGSRYSGFSRSTSCRPSQWGFGQRSKTRSRVTFEDSSLRYSSRNNTSLPDLRTEGGSDSGGDSTESLVEEAEHYLRRSIDCMLSGGTAMSSTAGAQCEGWRADKKRTRRASAPDPVRETDPPSGATPYLPRSARDLRIGHWVKVIGPEGRVRGGRVRHVGPIVEPPSQTQIATRETVYVGVELATPTGNSDGSYQGRRLFDCEEDHAIFVPFKKVIMAWST